MPRQLITPTGHFIVPVPAEQRNYEVVLYAPHLFALQISAAQLRFATSYAVNLGAGDGVSCNDPVYPLFQAGFSGLAVEGAASPALLNNLPAANIRKCPGTLITPNNVVALLEASHCPQSPDFLKVDIDGYDAPVLLEILKAGYRPKVIQLEVQPEFPPPLEFSVLFDPEYRCQDANNRVCGFYGASLSHMANLGRRFGYFPVQIDFISPFTHDVTLVDVRYRNLILDSFGIAERYDRDLFLNHPPGYSHFRDDDGIETFAWRSQADPHSLLKSVWTACVASCQKKHGKVLPFLLTVS
jgi:hypothetical protein